MVQDRIVRNADWWMFTFQTIVGIPVQKPRVALNATPTSLPTKLFIQ